MWQIGVSESVIGSVGLFLLSHLQLRYRNDSILSTLPEPPEQASLYRREREKEHDFHPRR